MKVKFITLFPEVYPGPMGVSVIGAALRNGIWSMETVNIRDFSKDRRATVDDTPYGGGSGMLIRPDVLGEAIDYAMGDCKECCLLHMSPRGKVFSNEIARELSKKDVLVFICARFEGIDQRVIDYYKPYEISIGDYVIADGDLASMIVLTSCLRFVDGVLGNRESVHTESFNTCDNGLRLLECDHYTRPSLWRGYGVPEVLCSGNHAEIGKWRYNNALTLTRKRRGDLLDEEKK